MELAESCFNKAFDWSGLLMLYSAQGNAKGTSALSDMAHEHGKDNIAFVCKYMIGDKHGCVDLLVECGRLPEAAFFARTYCPSRVTEVVKLWQSDLIKINPKAAESLANPDDYPNLFPGWDSALEREKASSNGVVTAPENLDDAMYLNQEVERLTVEDTQESNETEGDDFDQEEVEVEYIQESNETEGGDFDQEEVEEEVIPEANTEAREFQIEDEGILDDVPEDRAPESKDPEPVVEPEEDDDFEDEDDVLELTAEEEKLLEEELQGDVDDIDLDDDWGLEDDDEFGEDN
jgi:coatomer subunit beta'